jgi:hypothetical protein
MKTAMQLLIDALNNLEAVYTSNDQMREVVGVQQARNLAEYIYLEKEKEQIMDAYDAGYSHCLYGIHLNDEYYFETFNTYEE